MSKLLDRTYMMILPGNQGIVYNVMATDPGSVWRIVVNQEILGTGHTKETLWKQGYRVKKVEVRL